MQLKSTCGPRAMLFRFVNKRAKHYSRIGLIALLFVLFGESQTSIILKSVGN